MSTMTDMARHKDSDLFSGKAAAMVSLIGASVLAIAGQLEALFNWNPVATVTALCVLCASPYAFRTFYGSKEKMPIRIGLALISLIAAWHTLFQTTRGSSTTYDRPAPVPESYQDAPSLSGMTGGLLPLAVVLPKGASLDISLAGLARAPFRPVYRYNEKTRVYEVLIVHKGQHVWAESVQHKGSKRF